MSGQGVGWCGVGLGLVVVCVGGRGRRGGGGGGGERGERARRPVLRVQMLLSSFQAFEGQRSLLPEDLPGPRTQEVPCLLLLAAPVCAGQGIEAGIIGSKAPWRRRREGGGKGAAWRGAGGREEGSLCLRHGGNSEHEKEETKHRAFDKLRPLMMRWTQTSRIVSTSQNGTNTVSLEKAPLALELVFFSYASIGKNTRGPR